MSVSIVQILLDNFDVNFRFPIDMRNFACLSSFNENTIIWLHRANLMMEMKGKQWNSSKHYRIDQLVVPNANLSASLLPT